MQPVKNKILATTLLFFSLTSMPAFAEDACTPAKDMVRMVKAFYAADGKYLNIIEPEVQMKFEGINDNPTPDQILYRFEDQREYLDVDEDGFLLGIDRLKSSSKSGELCRVMDGKVAQKDESEGTSVNVIFKFPFRQTDGSFDVSDLNEGAKDGSKIMKGVAPGGLGFVVPGLKTIVLRAAEKDGVLPEFEFLQDGKTVSVDPIIFNKDRFFRLKDIKSSKADTLKIKGDYNLEATFKIDPEELAAAEAKRLEENP